ncbi:helix-turn-helix domain-containing protein [Labedaea rhizosphaerae]|uniref:Helix-turn-helix protein n=1 Tax=Labedaea rhizosphaerae TaxID=598644 RepID=A0A4R6SCE6_LABRH|nr:helix-turn-helix transcriptional regulator [Labedaea rhizosphaerae]TDP96706.1 helix-turn-helix protein [Labedaea rhizosphaerae]
MRRDQPRDRELGARLRAVRVEQAKLSLEAAAKLIGWSAAKLSRTENGRRMVTTEDVAVVLTTYKVPAAQREQMISDAQIGQQDGWWSRTIPGISPDLGTLAGYEQQAKALTDCSLLVVPGLLHTYAYAIGMLRAGGLSDTDAELRWMARLRRQQVLPGVEYRAFIGEAALHTPFGGAEALAEQLRALVSGYDRGLSIRLIPEHIPMHGLLHSWLLIESPISAPVLNVELIGSAVFVFDVEPYLQLLDMVDDCALSTSASRDKIVATMQGS